MAEKSSPGIRQTDSKNLVWFVEIERKLAKLSMSPLLTVLSLNYFMHYTHEKCSVVRFELSPASPCIICTFVDGVVAAYKKIKNTAQ
jgi:hypothetical protein